MDHEPFGNYRESAGRGFLTDLVNRTQIRDVTLAFWAVREDGLTWTLFFASPDVTHGTMPETYASLRQFWLKSTESEATSQWPVHLTWRDTLPLPADDEVALAAAAYVEDRRPVQKGECLLGRYLLEEAFFYPRSVIERLGPPVAATSD